MATLLASITGAVNSITTAQGVQEADANEVLSDVFLALTERFGSDVVSQMAATDEADLARIPWRQEEDRAIFENPARRAAYLSTTTRHLVGALWLRRAGDRETLRPLEDIENDTASSVRPRCFKASPSIDYSEACAIVERLQASPELSRPASVVLAVIRSGGSVSEWAKANGVAVRTAQRLFANGLRVLSRELTSIAAREFGPESTDKVRAALHEVMRATMTDARIKAGASRPPTPIDARLRRHFARSPRKFRQFLTTLTSSHDALVASMIAQRQSMTQILMSLAERLYNNEPGRSFHNDARAITNAQRVFIEAIERIRQAFERWELTSE